MPNTPAGEIVPRSSVVGIRRQSQDGTGVYYQQALWRELTWAEVDQKLREAKAQLNSARITVGLIGRLQTLHDWLPESTGPAAACVLLGLDMEAYLAGEQEITS